MSRQKTISISRRASGALAMNEPEPTISNIEFKARFSPEEVLLKAKQFFGPKGIGLSLCVENACWLLFADDAGSVALTVFSDEDGKGTPVEIITRDMRPLAREFIRAMLG